MKKTLEELRIDAYVASDAADAANEAAWAEDEPVYDAAYDAVMTTEKVAWAKYEAALALA